MTQLIKRAPGYTCLHVRARPVDIYIIHDSEKPTTLRHVRSKGEDSMSIILHWVRRLGRIFADVELSFAALAPPFVRDI